MIFPYTSEKGVHLILIRSLITAYSFSRYIPVVAEVMSRQADESDDLTAGLLPVVCDDRQR